MVIESLLDRYIRSEGFRVELYKDTKGFFTGGIGHKMTGPDAKRFNSKWSTERKIIFWLEQFQKDYYKAKGEAIKELQELNITLSPQQLEIITELKFNMGDSGFSSRKWPKFFRKLAEKDFDGAAYELLHDSKGNASQWLRDVGDRARRIAEELRNSND